MNAFKAGFVGLIGQPNAGKSTLLNLLVEEKVAIVNPKPQTTRRRVLGIVNTNQAQAVLVDAPGFVNAQDGLNKFLKDELEQVVDSADALLVLLNLDERKFENLEKIIGIAVASRKPWVPVITKTDLKDRIRRIPIIERELDKHGVRPLLVNQKDFSVDHRDEILESLLRILPSSAGPLYDLEMYTPHSYRELVDEIIREKCFEAVDKEVPYQLAVRVRAYDEVSSKKLEWPLVKTSKN